MTRIHTLACLAIACSLPFSAMADNFNYTDTNDCQIAMGGPQSNSYMNQAKALAAKQKPFSAEWQHAMNQVAFFSSFATAGSSSPGDCDGDNCIFTAAVGCNFAFNTHQAPWTTIIAPFLQKEVNYLQQGQYDPSLNSNTHFNLVCHYSKSQGNHWQQCQIQAA